MLAEAKAAVRLPWSTTRATVLELQMQGMSRLLPEGEALKATFLAELDRLYPLEPEADA